MDCSTSTPHPGRVRAFKSTSRSPTKPRIGCTMRKDSALVLFALYKGAGSYAARGFGELGMYGDEFCDMFVRCGGGGGTSEDLRLYARAFDFVHFLRGSPSTRIPGHPLSEAGAWVRENLGP